MKIISVSNGLSKLPQSMVQKLATNPLFIALDRDGTIVPICKNPKLAQLKVRDQKTINTLAACSNVTVAIVSARSGEKLKSDFTEHNLIFAGNYGLEVHYPTGDAFLHPQAISCLYTINQLKKDLETQLPKDLPLILDDHIFSLCLHYHLLSQELRGALRDQIEQLSASYSQLLCRSLPTSFEFFPNFPWTKADGLEEIHSYSGFNENPPLTLYFGDSSGDEPAFHWINAKKGISIWVGNNNETTSAATYQISSPRETMKFLEYLIELRNSF